MPSSKHEELTFPWKIFCIYPTFHWNVIVKKCCQKRVFRNKI